MLVDLTVKRQPYYHSPSSYCNSLPPFATILLNKVSPSSSQVCFHLTAGWVNLWPEANGQAADAPVGASRWARAQSGSLTVQGRDGSSSFTISINKDQRTPLGFGTPFPSSWGLLIPSVSQSTSWSRTGVSKGLTMYSKEPSQFLLS